MPVKLNTILSPREELAEIEVSLQNEKSIRQSIRINREDSYFQRQKAIIETQIKELQDKLVRLCESHDTAEEQIAESMERTKRLKKRQFVLRNRDKIEKLERLKKQIEELTPVD